MPGSLREIVIHADDLGMNHGANAAFAELSAAGVCTAGSVMIPCPWSLEIAHMQARDSSLDIGVHLTLTAEKQHYRWRPISVGGTRSGGLVDADGYFWRSVAELRRNAEPEAVEAELRAQIDAALAAGIDVTHLDDHMGAAFCPEFVGIYVRLGREYRLPVLIVASLAAYGPRHNIENLVDDEALARGAAQAVADGSPRFDVVLETPWRRGSSVEADYERLLAAAVPGGLSFFAMHFNAPGEIEWIEPETAFLRIEEYALFRGEAMAERLRSGAYALRGMRGYRDTLRRTRDAEAKRLVAGA